MNNLEKLSSTFEQTIVICICSIIEQAYINKLSMNLCQNSLR